MSGLLAILVLLFLGLVFMYYPEDSLTPNAPCADRDRYFKQEEER